MMSDLFSKFSKAVDAFADVLTENVTAKKSVALYKYSDLSSFVSQMKRKYPAVSRVCVSLTRQSEFDGMVFPETKYIVRVLLLDSAGQPISIDGKDDGYLGTVAIASAVDTQMDEFMRGRTERTVAVRGGN